MKLQVTQENLNRALTSVTRIATTRGTLPILSNILLKTIGNRLCLIATNLDIAITHFTGAKVSVEGAITVPARLMGDFISSLPPGTIKLETDNNHLQVDTSDYHSSINGTSADEYPVMPAITNSQSIQIPATDFKQALSRVIFAASTDDSRPVLTSVFINHHDNNLVLVATDSYRLAEKKMAVKANQVSLLVPASALQDLLRVLDESIDFITINYDDQQALFKIGDIELLTRLIDGQYPDYGKLIPTKFANSALLARSDLASIAKVSSLFARESAGGITIHLDPDRQIISINAIASQLGENTATAHGKIKGEGTITLNSRYLLDGLQAINTNQVEICFNGKLEPVLLRSPGSKDYLHVIMPLKS